MIKKLLLAGAVLTAIGQPVYAATITIGDPAPGGLRSVFVTGKIEPGDNERFRWSVASLSDRNVVVWLTSPGGNIVAGLDIGKQIRARRFATFVDDSCASVCGLMWLAGDRRMVVRTAHIGFHAAYDGSTGEVSSAGNALVGAYLNFLGFSDDAIGFLTDTPPDNSIQWLTAEVAEQYGITAQVLSPPKANRADVKISGQAPPWLLYYIPAVAMGILTLGFIAKTRARS
jgi:hypothetical protein